MSMINTLLDNEEEIRYLRLVKKVKMRDLAKMYNVTYSSMTHFLTTHAIVLNKKQVNNNIIDEIIKQYKDGKRYDYIARDFHLDKEAVRYILTSNGCDIREKSEALMQYTLNTHYFDEIDTPNKAYILGLLYTDGCRDGTNYDVKLKLQDRDVDILYKIRYEIESNKPLIFIEESKKSPTRRNQFLLSIQNKNTAKCLEKWGIVPNKTAIVTFPDFLKEDLIPHFIRGCWDGDGTISHNKKSFRTAIVGTEALLIGIKTICESKLNIHFSLSKHPSKLGNIRILSVGGRHQFKRFLDYIYNDAELYLNRKYSYYKYMCYDEALNNSLLT